MKPLVTQVADEIRYAWADWGVCLTLSRLRETDAGAVRGMITVSGADGGHIWWAMISLSTATDRKTLVAKLEAAQPRRGGWELDIDRCFQDAWERHVQVPDPVDLADVLDVSIDAEFLYSPVLPDGQVALLLADQGSTKSYLMLYLACCTVLGRATIFGPPRRQGPAIFFDWEVDERVARRRLGWICRGLGLDEVPRGLRYVNMADRGRLMDRQRDMRQQIDRIKPVLAVIDSLTFATGGDLNTAEYAAPTMSAIGGLGDGVTKLVSAHPNKASRQMAAEDVSVIGSGLFEYRARAIWLMKRESRRAARFMVSMAPRKPFDGAPQQPLAYYLHFDQAARAVHFEPGTLLESPELSNKALSLPDRIRHALAVRDLDTHALAIKCESTDAAVKTACGRMDDVFPKLVGGGRGNPTVWTRSAPNGVAGDVPWWNRGETDS